MEKQDNVVSTSRKHLAYALRLKSELLPKIEGCPHLQEWLDSFAALVATLGRKKRDRITKRSIKTAAELLELLHGETGHKLWPWVGYVLNGGELTERKCHTLAEHLRGEIASSINAVNGWDAQTATKTATRTPDTPGGEFDFVYFVKAAQGGFFSQNSEFVGSNENALKEAIKLAKMHHGGCKVFKNTQAYCYIDGDGDRHAMID